MGAGLAKPRCESGTRLRRISLPIRLRSCGEGQPMFASRLALQAILFAWVMLRTERAGEGPALRWMWIDVSASFVCVGHDHFSRAVGFRANEVDALWLRLGRK